MALSDRENEPIFLRETLINIPDIYTLIIPFGVLKSQKKSSVIVTN